jgi:hypothetical protein
LGEETKWRPGAGVEKFFVSNKPPFCFLGDAETQRKIQERLRDNRGLLVFLEQRWQRAQSGKFASSEKSVGHRYRVVGPLLVGWAGRSAPADDSVRRFPAAGAVGE